MSGFLGDAGDASGPDDLCTPFIFVPHGDPEPLEWMAAHPGWARFPATMVPRQSAGQQAETAEPRQNPQLPRRRFPGGSPLDVPDGWRKPGEGFAGPEPVNLLDAASYPDFVATYNHASRLIGGALLTPPAAPETWGLWSRVGDAATELFGAPSAEAQPAKQEPGRRGESGSGELDPAEALRLARFNAAMKALRAIEPDNPRATYFSTPEYIPDGVGVERLEAEIRDARARPARRLRVDRALPEGFPDQAALQRFIALLRERLAEGGILDAKTGLVGSSVTGLRYGTGEPFGPDSDLDVYVISPELFRRARQSGIELRSGKARTGALRKPR